MSWYKVIMKDAEGDSRAGLELLAISDISYERASHLSDHVKWQHVTVLNCAYKSIKNLFALPPSLKALFCYGNYLSSLPVLPNSLEILNCSHNLLLSLPGLPENLKVLTCNRNQLSSLPKLPNSLTFLDCSSNKIAEIRELPTSLTFMACSKNSLIYIPYSPFLRDLSCYENPGLEYDTFEEWKERMRVQKLV